MVRDYGQGLSEEDQRQVWECFYQSPDVKVLSGSGVGLGLGLYLNRTLIEHHHGQVGVESTPGKGSTFWFSLPLAST
jgi:signal transduction histidine kinase